MLILSHRGLICEKSASPFHRSSRWTLCARAARRWGCLAEQRRLRHGAPAVTCEDMIATRASNSHVHSKSKLFCHCCLPFPADSLPMSEPEYPPHPQTLLRSSWAVNLSKPVGGGNAKGESTAALAPSLDLYSSPLQSWRSLGCLCFLESKRKCGVAAVV